MHAVRRGRRVARTAPFSGEVVAAMRENTLELTIEATHRSLASRLDEATTRARPRSRPRDAFARTDAFLAATSRHLAAVDAVLVPVARRRLDDGATRTHDYLHQARLLEMSLAQLKARLYGEAHAVHVPWRQVWSDVRRQLSRHNRLERGLVLDLADRLSPDERDQLAQAVYRSEVRGPTRPHPYTPHQGMPGLIARRLWALADRFWDAAEGRVIPEPVRPHPHPEKHDSLIAQYVLGLGKPAYAQPATR